ncbi:hypothetical protein Q75_08230 [Bacillus coahuilensis p1.1.43]|uniref:DUF4367 domain-containing protein n=1 Tax=Bacillus coahuilensis p1.1.43 TaxID=1150625 RepID=A0A147K8J7_9BACI|nr:hypothetical protein [Bacillus coahuilensis]KUP06504.1 hypothetical protein Q75_08230 [Bacillus coahuilensis p1.1.43]
MKRNLFDEEIRNRLKSGSEVTNFNMIKDEMWKNIEAEIQSEPSSKPYSTFKVRKFFSISSIVLVSIVILFFTIHDEGQALVSKMKDWLVPEKEITTELEGQTEQEMVQLQKSNEEYIIYFDESRYNLLEGEDKDQIVLNEPLPEEYPKVLMEIQTMTTSLEDTIETLHEEAIIAYEEVSPISDIEEPLKGKEFRSIGGSGGQEWDDPVIKTIVVPNPNGGTFVFTQYYFLEAAEGHGARFTQMLTEFQTITRP